MAHVVRHLRWLIKCESIMRAHQDIRTILLQRWYSVLGGWLQLSHASLPPEVVDTTRFAIAAFLRLCSLLQVTPPGPNHQYWLSAHWASQKEKVTM